MCEYECCLRAAHGLANILFYLEMQLNARPDFHDYDLSDSLVIQLRKWNTAVPHLSFSSWEQTSEDNGRRVNSVNTLWKLFKGANSSIYSHQSRRERFDAQRYILCHVLPWTSLSGYDLSCASSKEHLDWEAYCLELGAMPSNVITFLKQCGC